MTLRLIFYLLLFSCSLGTAPESQAINFFFEPDTVVGSVGQSVWLSARIDSTQLMRGFTIYMAYDTNFIDLDTAPVAGPVIAGHAGLQFNYFDHAPFEPDLLEVGGTIFGTAFWHGPGELFRVRFLLRQCGLAPISAPFPPFFVAADGTYPTVTFNDAVMSICPNPPIAVSNLTIISINQTTVNLQWSSVNADINGFPLPVAPLYQIYKQQYRPTILPETNIATVLDTFFVDTFNASEESVYHIIVQISP